MGRMSSECLSVCRCEQLAIATHYAIQSIKHSNAMPNQRDPDKVRLGFWITEEEREAIKKDMKKLGIETYSDYIIYKLGIDREDEGDNN